MWLDGFHAAQGARSGVLCRRHADAMVVPLGWMLDDRRESAPRLFRSPAEAPDTPGATGHARRRSRQRSGDDTLQLRLDTIADELDLIEADVPEVVPETAPMVEDVVETAPVAPWRPVFDQNDDLSGLLKARGRLLSRAFNGTTTDGS